MKRLGVLLLSCCLPLSVTAVEQIAVEALFTDKAMVKIDGVRRLLKLNQASPEGVVLISANSREAVLEVAGQRRSYALGSHVSSSFTKPLLRTAKILRDRSGSYTTVGSINGLNVDFLVDTGASGVALNDVEARRLGLPYKLNGRKIMVGTANGMTLAYQLMLDEVRVGDITLNQVQGFVVDSNGPAKALLGMSFLGRVKMENQGPVLLLQQKF